MLRMVIYQQDIIGMLAGIESGFVLVVVGPAQQCMEKVLSTCCRQQSISDGYKLSMRIFYYFLEAAKL